MTRAGSREQVQKLPGGVGGHEEEVVGVPGLQLEPVELVYRHRDAGGVVDLVGHGHEQVAAGERVCPPIHGEAHIAVDEICKLKAVPVVVGVQRGDGVGGIVVAVHPQAGDLQRLTRQHLPLLGVDGGIHPGDGLLFHRTAPLAKSSILYCACF